MRVVFAVIAGPHQGQTFSFEGHDTFLVGRSPAAHFRLPKKDEYFSRLHFLVEVNPPQCRLIDMGSTNGTLVNGSKVTATDLHDGDLIQGGQTTLRVSVIQDDGETVTRRAALPPPAPLAEPVTLPTLPPEAALAVTGAFPAAEPCRGCEAPLSERPPGQPWPLCAACLGEMRQQPQFVPGYTLLRELGRGGMGVVYQALAPPDGAVVALKTITPTDPDEIEVERFLREADILRQLSHPNIVSFRKMGVAQGRLYFAMD